MRALRLHARETFEKVRSASSATLRQFTQMVKAPGYGEYATAVANSTRCAATPGARNGGAFNGSRRYPDPARVSAKAPSPRESVGAVAQPQSPCAEARLRVVRHAAQAAARRPE